VTAFVFEAHGQELDIGHCQQCGQPATRGRSGAWWHDDPAAAGACLSVTFARLSDAEREASRNRGEHILEALWEGTED
jgi:hypothetical protein